MAEGVIHRNGRVRGGRLLALAITLAAAPALAESTPAGTTVLGVRAGNACLKEQIRITGFATAREEGGASVPLDGYRVTDILVNEGDIVSVGQELLRAAKLGDDTGQNPAQSAAMPRPASYSLRAPLAGLVTRINARIGMITSQPAAAPPQPGQPMMPPEPQVRIMADAGVDLVVDVPSLYATKLRSGLVARVLADGGDEIRGTVRVPVSEVDPATQLGRARLSIDPPSALRPGQFASAIMETARDCGLSVPRSAVTYQNGAPTVQVLNGTSVETRSVRTGLFDENSIQIREGLNEGDPVIANAGTALRSGDRVTPVIPDAKGAGR